MMPTHRLWTASHRILGSESMRSDGTAKSAHVGIEISWLPARFEIRTMPLVDWTTNEGLTAIHGSGGSQSHVPAWAIPGKLVVTCWTRVGAATAGAAATGAA